MKVIFLGTGPSRAIPRPVCVCAACKDARRGGKSARTRSSILIQEKDTCVLIDTSPDFLAQAQREKIKRIDAVFFTHEHIDATGGFDDFLFWCRARALEPKIFVSAAVKAFLYKHCAPVLNKNRWVVLRAMQPYRIVRVGDLLLEPLSVRHGVSCDVPTVGYRVNRALVYASDFDEIPARSRERMCGARVLIFDAAMWFFKAIRGHLDPRRAIAAAISLHPQRLYLTQIGHTYPPHADAQRQVSAYARTHDISFAVRLAYDGHFFEL